MLDFSDRTRTGISKLISRCAFLIYLLLDPILIEPLLMTIDSADLLCSTGWFFLFIHSVAKHLKLWKCLNFLKLFIKETLSTIFILTISGQFPISINQFSSFCVGLLSNTHCKQNPDNYRPKLKELFSTE